MRSLNLVLSLKPAPPCHLTSAGARVRSQVSGAGRLEAPGSGAEEGGGGVCAGRRSEASGAGPRPEVGCPSGRRRGSRAAGGAGALQAVGAGDGRHGAGRQEVGGAPATVKEPRGGWAELRSVVHRHAQKEAPGVPPGGSGCWGPIRRAWLGAPCGEEEGGSTDRGREGRVEEEGVWGNFVRCCSRWFSRWAGSVKWFLRNTLL
jgi:hypothetical protein